MPFSSKNQILRWVLLCTLSWLRVFHLHERALIRREWYGFNGEDFGSSNPPVEIGLEGDVLESAFLPKLLDMNEVIANEYYIVEVLVANPSLQDPSHHRTAEDSLCKDSSHDCLLLAVRCQTS